MRSVRIQVVLDERERAAFRRQARTTGMSLSAWLREAGRERLRQSTAETHFGNSDELHSFFQSCDKREAGAGHEPDWEEHARVIEQSRRHGLPNP